MKARECSYLKCRHKYKFYKYLGLTRIQFANKNFWVPLKIVRRASTFGHNIPCLQVLEISPIALPCSIFLQILNSLISTEKNPLDSHNTAPLGTTCSMKPDLQDQHVCRAIWSKHSSPPPLPHTILLMAGTFSSTLYGGGGRLEILHEQPICEKYMYFRINIYFLSML